MPKIDDRFWFLATVKDKPVRARSWGFYLSKKKAVEHVMRGGYNLAENGHYSHAVIEGVAPFDAPGETNHWEREELWFHLDRESGEAVPCDKPEALEKVTNFTLG